jgi:hypothetical protein
MQPPTAYTIVDQHTAMVANLEQTATLDDGTPNFTYPMALHNDVLHYGDMLQAEDRSDFVSAMQNEMAGLQDILQVVPRSSLPADIKPLPAVWAFKRKRLPDWTILKHKARLNVHGGKQKHGVNYWETYSPVVNWSTVRLTMILSLLKHFKCRQVDFVQAFTQAPIDCPVFMEIPAGYTIQDNKLVFTGVHHKATDKTHVLKLLKNMYGLKQAGCNWYNTLTDMLLKSGFCQSSIDKCLFIRHNCIVIVYVDDCLLFSPHESILDEVITSLNKQFKITSSNSIDTYLGLAVTHNPDGTITLHQPGLIDKVITLCGLEAESNEHLTPADKILFPALEGDAPRQHNWSYRQVIGILNYIAATSRPDITFAVHQCARFSHNPNRNHEIAVRRIVRYLKGTRDKGYILRPTETPTIDCYADADFAGSWTLETSDNPDSVKSRTGYLITFAGCPILWSSKLQSEIALSTTEAEYIALSQAMRDLIPMRTIMHEMSTVFGYTVQQAITHSTVFEDNKGCVDLIAAPTMRPRSRHISIKYHHFREHVRKGLIRIRWISTDMQLADIFTKPLASPKFTLLRQRILGW